MNLKKNKTMLSILSIIANQTWLKYCFGYSFSISSIALIEQNLGEGDFFTRILQGVPSKVIVVLGIIYGVALVGRQVSTLIKQIKIDNLEVKQAKEKLNQEKIETAEKQKDLDAD